MINFELWKDFHCKENFTQRQLSARVAAQANNRATKLERCHSGPQEPGYKGSSARAICVHKLPCTLSLRLGMLWGSLWRKPLCTTGMTWICRTWWITFKKRCSTLQNVCCCSFSISHKLYALCYFGLWESFPQGETCYIQFLHSVGLLMWYHLHTLAHHLAWVFPWEKPNLAGCTVHDRARSCF